MFQGKTGALSIASTTSVFVVLAKHRFDVANEVASSCKHIRGAPRMLDKLYIKLKWLLKLFVTLAERLKEVPLDGVL